MAASVLAPASPPSQCPAPPRREHNLQHPQPYKIALMLSAQEALKRLREGNFRFVSDVRGGQASLGPERRSELARQQEPFAIVLGCSDSRVPAEIVFDQG